MADKKAEGTLYVLKFLTPQTLAAAVIGKGGASISAMRTSCDAKISITDQGEFYPATDCRVLTAQASTQEALDKVAEQIVEKVAEVAKGASPDAPIRDAVGTEGELKLRVLMPRSAVGGLIGKEGAAIKKLIETSGAKISVGDAPSTQPSSEQIVTVSGEEKGITTVMKEVNAQVQALNGEAWFATWAAGTSGPSTLAMGSVRPGASPGLDLMMRVAQQLPPYVMEDSRGFALNCIVPSNLVGGLIGRGGAGTREVQATTKTKISIRDIPGDDANRSLTIAGPLPNACAAYMLMMKRYLDAEGQGQRR
mmetsp:Transcript_48709/g.115758  ORF Transcript_48709/g.115758 Transcript_48709/m.115758 type:complete len:308 (+) Transcript_48709:222-1145(+)